MAADRCEHCLASDRAAAGPPIPWETSAGFVARWLKTLATAWRPMRTAPGFARLDRRPAISFALLTTLPLALLSGLIPYTFTLRFGPTFHVSLIGSPTQTDIVLDLARAAGVGLLISAIELLALGASFVSLCRAYGEEEGASAAALRGLLYRSFLLPLAGIQGVLASLAAWGLPQGAMGSAEDPGTGAYLVPMLLLIPFVLYFTSLRQSARLASGLKPIPSFIAAIIPFVLMILVAAVAHSLLAPLMPPAMPLPT